MKKLVTTLPRLLALAMLVSAVQSASAFYDPSIQRWINRDPLADSGSLVNINADYSPELGTNMLANPLGEWNRVNVNIYLAFGDNPVNNVDALGLDFLSCYADCIRRYRDPIGNGVAEICNAGLNKAAGPTRRSGVGGRKPGRPTTWQNKLGREIARKIEKPWVGQVGKTVGRGAVVITIFDGFFDWGLLVSCATSCAEPSAVGEPPLGFYGP